MSAALAPLLEEPKTASEVGLTPYERAKLEASGIIQPVVRKGEEVVRRTGKAGRPGRVFKLTRKGRAQVARA